MGRKRKAPRQKSINPHFWVFCEGETEEAYIAFLRSAYRVPIEIISKVVGSRITDRFIVAHKKGKPVRDKDKDFLMYDADVSVIVENLKKIKNATLLLSNPTLELWFLLHYKSQHFFKPLHKSVSQINKYELPKGLHQ